MHDTRRPVVMHIITNLGDGGAQSVLRTICEFDTGVSHHVISLRGPGKYGDVLESIGVRVDCLGLSKRTSPFGAARKLSKLIKSVQPDVIQTWMYHANLFGGTVARFAGCRNVSWGIYHATLSLKELKWTTLAVVFICALLSRRVPKVIVLCATAAVEPHAKVGYDRRLMVVVPSGFDLSRFRFDADDRQSFRDELEVGSDTVLFGCVARVHPAKDHMTLLEAIARFAHDKTDDAFRFVLVGTDTNGSALLDEIKKRDLERFVIPLGPRNDIPRIMSGLDLHVSSSLTEGFPSVLCEAMACETPCITTNVGDAAIIVDENGWVVQPRNPAALSSAMSEAFGDITGPEASALKVQASESIKKRFTIEAMVAGYRSAWGLSDALG